MRFKIIACVLAVASLSAIGSRADDNAEKKGEIPQGGSTNMKMVSAGAGLGFGVKDYRVIFVFANDETFTKFLYSGWSGSAQADAAAKVGKLGEAYSGATEVGPGV